MRTETGSGQMKVLLAVDQAADENSIRFSGMVANKLAAHLDFWLILETAEEMDNSRPLLEREAHLLAGLAPEVEATVKKGYASEILGNIRKKQYDLIILSFRGRRGLKMVFPRPEIVTIVREVKIPIMAVWGDRKTISRVLFCTGGSSYAQEAIEFGGKIAKAFGASATILHISEMLHGIYAENAKPGVFDDIKQRDHDLWERLNHSVNTLQDMGIETKTVVRYGRVPDKIMKEIDIGDYDLVVMSSHGISGIRRLILGSTCEYCLKHSHVPVLVVPAHHAMEHPVYARIVGE